MANDRGVFGGIADALGIIRRELPRWWVDANRGRYMRPPQSVMAPPGAMEMSTDDIVPADVAEFALEMSPLGLLATAEDAEGAKGKAPKSGLVGKVRRAVKKAAPDLSPLPWAGERYPKTRGMGEWRWDKTKKDWYVGKALSPEEELVQLRRKAAQADIDAGNYEPYFDLSKRSNVDPSHYTVGGDSSKVLPATAKTVAKWEAVANDPKAIAKLKQAFAEGSLDPNAKDWYAMRQLEKAYIDEFGAKVGRERFQRRFADSMAATTGGASPSDNLMMAHYGNYLMDRGLPYPTSSLDIPYPVGHARAVGNLGFHEKFVSKGLPFGNENPKRMNFSANFTGHGNRATMDEQMMGAWGMSAPPQNTYGIFENVVKELAKAENVPAMNYQDVTWKGLKKVPGKPMMQHINETIERTHRITGLPKEEILRRGILRDEIPLYQLGLLGIGTGTLASSLLNEQ